MNILWRKLAKCWPGKLKGDVQKTKSRSTSPSATSFRTWRALGRFILKTNRPQAQRFTLALCRSFPPKHPSSAGLVRSLRESHLGQPRLASYNVRLALPPAPHRLRQWQARRDAAKECPADRLQRKPLPGPLLRLCREFLHKPEP